MILVLPSPPDTIFDNCLQVMVLLVFWRIALISLTRHVELLRNRCASWMLSSLVSLLLCSPFGLVNLWVFLKIYLCWMFSNSNDRNVVTYVIVKCCTYEKVVLSKYYNFSSGYL